ncbi:MAG: polysaccharide biosynthesis/export family protein [Pseudomonadota bacterium]
MKLKYISVYLVISTLILTGCESRRETPIGPIASDAVSQRQMRIEAHQRLTLLKLLAEIPPLNESFTLQSPPLSPGDQLRIAIADGEEFSGLFEVNLDGKLHLPYLSPQSVMGKSLVEVEQILTRALIDEGFFREDFVRVSATPLQWASIPITVAGAVFQPGRVVINDSPVALKEFKGSQDSGDAPLTRNLTSALRSAGGIRPDADVTNVTLIRDSQKHIVNVSGVFTGEQVKDIPLIAGDQIIVPSIGYVQQEYARPSLITPPGFKVFMSNLSTPAPNNSSASISKGSIDMPYGSTMLHGLIAANCIGGTRATNASREAVLVTTDRITGELKVLKRSIERLAKHPNQGEFNPLLMPNDGIACYDSGVTNVRDVARSISDILSPVSMLSNVLLLRKLLSDDSSTRY